MKRGRKQDKKRKAKQERGGFPLSHVPSRWSTVETAAACGTKQLGVAVPCCWFLAQSQEKLFNFRYVLDLWRRTPSIVLISLVNPKKAIKNGGGRGVCRDPCLLRGEAVNNIKENLFNFRYVLCVVFVGDEHIDRIVFVGQTEKPKKGGGMHGPSLGEVWGKPFPTPPWLPRLLISARYFLFVGLKQQIGGHRLTKPNCWDLPFFFLNRTAILCHSSLTHRTVASGHAKLHARCTWSHEEKERKKEKGLCTKLETANCKLHTAQSVTHFSRTVIVLPRK